MSVHNDYTLWGDPADRSFNTKLPMPDAEVTFYPGFFSPEESDLYLKELTTSIAWQQESIRLPKGKVPFPRLTAWYGDAGKNYAYSGVISVPNPWTDTLLAIKNQVETVAGVEFNSVLLNFYRDNNDSVGWHSDDEPELGANPVIASVSFGSTRSFQFKHKEEANLKTAVSLSHGSLLIMRGTTQHFWKHRIPKITQLVGPRINLTFRVISS